jgi:hypothetical protein
MDREAIHTAFRGLSYLLAMALSIADGPYRTVKFSILSFPRGLAPRSTRRAEAATMDETHPTVGRLPE